MGLGRWCGDDWVSGVGCVGGIAGEEGSVDGFGGLFSVLLLWIAGREEVENGVLINWAEALCVSDDKCGEPCVVACAVVVVGRRGGLLVFLRWSAVAWVIQGSEGMAL